MKHRVDEQDDIRDTVRRAITEELPKALEPFLRQLAPGSSPTPDIPELVSRQQAATILGVSIQTIAKLITEGTLSAVRVRRRVLIPQSAITAYLRSREVDGSKGGK